ncbi:transketolase family protein [Cellulomonas taurus]|uniref:transketolase family protein n=1 Tax=Cellulomonas taurus TaxID=2729175 RepID=UPI00145DD673|nr:transketolase C-terminal domain-containing protein [Cellulomonas taurus]
MTDLETMPARPRQSMRPPIAGLLASMGDADPNLVVLAADGRALALPFAARHPDRFFDVGIAEATVMGVAGGLARAGHRVVVCGMAPFLVRRAVEQIRLDVCGPGLDVTILAVGGGVGYGGLGSSHHVPEDLGTMMAMPHTRVFCPADIPDALWAVERAITGSGPAYVRLAAREVAAVHDEESLPSAQGIRGGGDRPEVVVIATGSTVGPAHEAVRRAQAVGISSGVLELVQVWPFPYRAVADQLRSARRIVVVEEHLAGSGVGARTALALCGRWHGTAAFLAIREGPTPPGEIEALARHYGIDADSVLHAMTDQGDGGL